MYYMYLGVLVCVCILTISPIVIGEILLYRTSVGKLMLLKLNVMYFYFCLTQRFDEFTDKNMYKQND